jgi:HNH endonuclease
MTPEEFWSLVDTSDPNGCHPWTGSTLKNGYGRVSVDGVLDMAHRHAWRLSGRPIGPGQVIRHLRCDNPPCCRLDHLAAGSQGDNLRDAAQKGRLAGSIHGPGVRHRFARLTEADVLAIRALAAQGTKPTEIARRYGMSQPAVSRIINRQRWGHL